jgi:acetolactate synthase-1/2/3 large subunit
MDLKAAGELGRIRPHMINDKGGSPEGRPRNGGRILAQALRVHGADRVFCVPGESFIEILDGLYDLPEIQVVVAKHEGAAANMAAADGKLSGRPGICLVTRGPGAAHASVGVHTAFQDSAPMILLIGQVPRGVRGRETFQEVEYHEMFAPLAKWVAEVDDPARIHECILHAFQCATSGRPGPVVLSLPEDTLAEVRSVADTAPYRAVQAAPGAADLEAFRSEIARSARPLLVVGGTGWSEEACSALEEFVEENSLPVLSSFRRQDLLNNEHRCYAGHIGLHCPPCLAGRLHSADLIIALGTRLRDIANVLPPPRIPQRLVHIYSDPDELGRIYQADLPINAGPARFAFALRGLAPIASPVWRAWTEESRQEFLQFTTVSEPASKNAVDFAAVVSHLSSCLPPDAVVSNGAGNFTYWLHRYFKYKQLRTEGAATSGAMGYGLPAAIAAKLRFPDRISVCVAGDGCFLMYAQELTTALQYHSAIIVLVVNNGMYGTIRMHQEMRFPGRVIATELQNPDFLTFARACGAYAERVETTDAFPAALERAVAAQRPALLELCVDPDQITPDRRLPF